jgi:RNase_H superfamily
LTTWRTVSRRRIFAFDVEARPGPWQGSDFTFRHMLSIAGRYVDRGPMRYLAPGFSPDELEDFIEPLRSGSMALTHNGPKYDLPFLSGTLIRAGLRPLPKLLVTDTYAHLPKRGQAFSASLGNLTRRFDVRHQKGAMSEVAWDLAYQGDLGALEKLRRYNTRDVLATIALRERLLELGLLGEPRWWTP